MVQPSLHPVAGGPHLPPEVGHGGVEIALRILAPLPVVGVGAAGVQPGPVVFPGLLQQGVHEGVPRLPGLQLVSEGQHHEGGMAGQAPQNLPQLRPVVGPRLFALKGVLRIPVGQLRLHQHAHLVRRREGRLRRAVAVEPHAVHAVVPVFQQDPLPAPDIHGAVSRFGKHRAVRLAPQEDLPPVERQMPLLRREIPDAEAHALGLDARRGHNQGIHLPFPDFPFLRAVLQAQGDLFFLPSGRQAYRHGRRPLQSVAPEMEFSAPFAHGVRLEDHPQLIPPRIDPQVGEEYLVLLPQPDPAQQPVPVGLRLIRSRGSVHDGLPGPPRIAVVGQEGDLVVPRHKARHLEAPGRGQASRPVQGRFLPVHEQPQLPRPLHVHERPHPRRRLPFHGPGDPRASLEGMLPRQPGHNGIPRLPESYALYLLRLPLLRRIVRESDPVLVQRSRQMNLRLHPRDFAFPCSGKI